MCLFFCTSSKIFTDVILKKEDKNVGKIEPVVGPQNASVLTDEEKRRALEAMNLIKEKRTGNIKGRTCANGSKQKQY